jgi:hypothetical protein
MPGSVNGGHAIARATGAPVGEMAINFLVAMNPKVAQSVVYSTISCKIIHPIY